ncbi:MAG: YihY/virulence factor BrkB family protein [Lentisphaerales bacterium]|nr:MAG: YihY/virulence factor BrkB family protein [Lentisphaerales bacterium]
MSKMKKINWLKVPRRVWRFITEEDVWDIELSSLSAIRRAGIKTVRVVLLDVKGFREDQCPLRASALTFSTLMSLVPVLAVSLALARGFGAGDKVVDQMKSALGKWTESFESVTVDSNPVVEPDAAAGTIAGEEVVVEEGEPQVKLTKGQIDDLVSMILDSVSNVNFTALGGVGLATLLLTVVLVLGGVESSFNKVWGVTEGRPLYRKFFDYLGVLIVLPILGVAASSLPVAQVASKYVDESTANVIKSALGAGGIKNLAVLAMTTLTFTFLIMFMPNTRVKVTAGLAGGFVAALLFVVWLWVCARMQVGAVKYLKIYASFAVIPIVLFWVYVSWEIILFGAEVAFAVQHCTTYGMETKAHTASIKSRLALAMSIVGEAAKAMGDGGPVFEIPVYARENSVPVRLLNEVVDNLVQARFLGELSERPGCFVLLKSSVDTPVKAVIDAMLQAGTDPHEFGLNVLKKEVEQALAKADSGMAQAIESMRLKDLAS